MGETLQTKSKVSIDTYFEVNSLSSIFEFVSIIVNVNFPLKFVLSADYKCVLMQAYFHKN